MFRRYMFLPVFVHSTYKKDQAEDGYTCGSPGKPIVYDRVIIQHCIPDERQSSDYEKPFRAAEFFWVTFTNYKQYTKNYRQQSKAPAVRKAMLAPASEMTLNGESQEAKAHFEAQSKAYPAPQDIIARRVILFLRFSFIE